MWLCEDGHENDKNNESCVYCGKPPPLGAKKRGEEGVALGTQACKDSPDNDAVAAHGVRDDMDLSGQYMDEFGGLGQVPIRVSDRWHEYQAKRRAFMRGAQEPREQLGAPTGLLLNELCHSPKSVMSH